MRPSQLTVRDGGQEGLQRLLARAVQRPHHVAAIAVRAHHGLAAPLPGEAFQLLRGTTGAVNRRLEEAKGSSGKGPSKPLMSQEEREPLAYSWGCVHGGEIKPVLAA